MKASTSFPILTFDKSSKSQQGVVKVWIREYKGITGNENNRVYRKTSNYTVHDGKECLFTLQPEEHSDFLALTEDNLSQITAVLPKLIRQDCERMRREEAEKRKRLDELKQGRPEEMTVIILRDVLKEMKVPFKLSDKIAVLVSKLREARAKHNPSLSCSQESLSGSS